MTTIKELSERAQRYIRTGKEMTLEYLELEKKLEKQLQDQIIGREYLRDTLIKHREDTNRFLLEGKKEIEELIERTREFEKSLITDKEEPVTADMVAELDMLEKTIAKGENLSNYANKYKNVPLAMKRLKNIAIKNGSVLVDTKSKEEQLDTMLANIKRHVEYASAPKYDKYDSVFMEMIADGNANQIGQDLEAYKSL